jgi:hypothetical protein
MALTKLQATNMAILAAAATDTQPRRMNARCMVIAQQVFGAMPAQVPAVFAGYIALRWLTPDGQPRSHVAVYLSEGGASFVVDAAWQQYPFVAKMETYAASTRAKHTRLPLGGRDRADQKATDPATRVHVGTPDEWQAMVEGYNSVGLAGIVRKVFAAQPAASDWMAFRN